MVTQGSRWDDLGTEPPVGAAKYVGSEQPIAEYDNWINSKLVADIAACIASINGLGTMSGQSASNVNITGGLVQNIADILIADGGTGASTAAQARNNLGLGTMALQSNNNINISGGIMTGVPISNSDLKSATGEVSLAPGGSGDLTLPGGEYSFFPQSRVTGNITDASITLAGSWNVALALYSTSYLTMVAVKNPSPTETIYIKNRYLTASGTEYWIFALRDKSTKKIISNWSAFDHPCVGNGNNPDMLPHPFLNYDSHTQEIILLSKKAVEIIQKSATNQKKSMLTVLNENYDFDLNDQPFIPMHSGKWIEMDGQQEKEMIMNIPIYIRVKDIHKKK